jgi:hypothetical protein
LRPLLRNTADCANASFADVTKQYYNPQTKETAPLVKKRRIRVEGGAAPLAKPITIDYDSDDGRIIELKQQGYSDSSIAEMLRQEGRTRYVDKTIGSRFLRIRKLLQEKEDERLDDELSDWHAGEVCCGYWDFMT